MIASKSTLTFASIAFALLFGGGVYLYMNLGGIAERIAEDIATKTLGVDVDIGLLTIDIPDKTITVRGMEIANPEGFHNSKAVTVDLIKIKAASLSRELLVFDQITVSGTTAYLEVMSHGTNFAVIAKNAQSRKNTAKTEQPVKVIIRDLLIEKSRLSPTVLISAVDPGDLDVKQIHMQGIGENSNGVLASQAIAQIWSEVSKEFNMEAAQQGLLKGLSQAALMSLGVPAILQIPGVRDTLVEGAGAVGGVVEDGIKGIFGIGKEEEE